MNSNFNTWFETFISEKEIPYSMFELDHNNEIHFIDSDTVIDLIKNASPGEQKTIKNALVYLDFRNADINDYLKHLAICYLKSNYKIA